MNAKAPRLMDIDDCTEDLRNLAEEHPDLWKDFLGRFEFSRIYHENALEGIVVTHAELDTALRGRPIAPDTYHAIRNLKLAMSFIRKEVETRKAPIDMELVRKIHEVLGEGKPDFQPGRYRKIIPLHRTYFHDIAQPQSIAPRMNKLMDWAAANDPHDDEAVQFAAHLHHEFMSIFPFGRHTGKVGRLLVNLILQRHGYMPVIIHATERQRYYDRLRHSRKEMEGFLIEMMLNCIDNAVTFIHKQLEERNRQRLRFAAVS